MLQYIVQPRDTLKGIAVKALGNMNRWPEIASLNRLANPNHLLVGQLLELPGARPAVANPLFAMPQAANHGMAADSTGLGGHPTVSNPPSTPKQPGREPAQVPATLAWARGCLFVVFEQLSEMSGKLIRKVAVIPKDFSLVPENLLGKLTLAEHVMALSPAKSQFLSASQKIFGAPSINGRPFLIDVAKAEAAGTKIIPMEQIVAELKQLSPRPHLENLIDIIQTVEEEVLIEGGVAGKAVSKLSAVHTAYVRSAENLWKKFKLKQITKAQLEAELKSLEGAFGKARLIGRLGRAVTVVGVIFTVKDIAEAAQHSVHQMSYKPLAAESIRQVGGWGGAIAGSKLGFAAGALFGIETGPGAIATGAIGAILVGGAAYYGFDLLADKLSPN